MGQASEAIPQLSGLFNLCYCREEARSQYLYRKEGQVFWISSDTGVDQGDGIAPVLFSFGMKPGATALLQELEDLSRQRCDSVPVLVLLYLDNVYVAVP